MKNNNNNRKAGQKKDIPEVRLLTASSSNSTKSYSYRSIESLTLSTEVPLVITPRLEAQILQLCQDISRDEWSGTLLYRTEGTFGQPNFKFISKYIYLQDIGSQAYTEYELGKDLPRFLMKNKEFMGMKWGHIHSHNSMGVFFSGTDTDEIEGNSKFHAFYLSLIVNNKHDMMAKIAFRASKKLEGKSTTKGVNVLKDEILEHINIDEEKEVCLVYNCKIERDLSA